MFGEQNVRKEINRRLSTGQTIGLTASDEKMLRSAYDHMQGYAKRSQLEGYLEQKRQELTEMETQLPNFLPKGSASHRASMALSRKDTKIITKDSLDDDDSQELQAYKRFADELVVLEDNLALVAKEDCRISIKDLDALITGFGVSVQKRVLEHMIYEVDELVDDVICWDEFCLCYHRNVHDTTGSEPSAFFRIMEFVTFDFAHRGVVMEDDVMEILFVRIGAGRLEQEIKSIFGNNLRALGGTGTLTLEVYLGACLRKTGRRALTT